MRRERHRIHLLDEQRLTGGQFDTFARSDIRRSTDAIGRLQVRHDVIDNLEDALLTTLDLLQLLQCFLVVRSCFRLFGFLIVPDLGTVGPCKGQLLVKVQTYVPAHSVFIHGHHRHFLPFQIRILVYLHSGLRLVMIVRFVA